MEDHDDWGLQAVVRSCAATSSSSATINTSTTCSVDDYSWLSFQAQEENLFPRFPDLLEPRSGSIEELHDLYKPFFPKTPPLSPQIIPISPFSVLGGIQDLSQPQQQKQQKQELLQAKQPVLGGSRSTIAGGSTAQTPRSKRRKNQLKRVREVPAEGLSSDTWSWRKYGQKPIKGSPYPRGYYRCSTSKGCMARKQVERNRSDPGMFTVTYTGEHNHPIPTHRNSLAGVSRQKPTSSQTVTADETIKPSFSSPVSPAGSLSPATEKTESREEREDNLEVEDEEDGLLGFSDMAMSDDFFVGLEELAGPADKDCSPDHSPASLQFPWLTNSATTTAASGH
ncbi:unnamed protein product [Ilex paraguariensis]|uniref:WRKY domain-containing protein n=1 Tax=Ilex paraguariensis TaxID=185542 RepID=A0ABC8SNY0_9AQUA